MSGSATEKRVPAQPRTEDIIIRCRDEKDGPKVRGCYILCHWPEQAVLLGGPFATFGAALIRARLLAARRCVRVWFDDASAGAREQLLDVT